MRRLLDSHLDDTTLRTLAFDAGTMSDAAAAHLSGCSRCQARAAAVHHALDALTPVHYEMR